jgi:NAD(P)-dependent dehydrogenase (short-subunit alcohol dehydrogenase family)
VAQQRVLVVGAAKGIGEGACRVFAEKGWRIAAADIDRETLDALGQELSIECCLHGDVRDMASVTAMVEQAEQALGGLDAVAIIAGVISPGEMRDMTDEAWTRLLDINLDGSVRVMRASVDALERSGGGAIVLISSIAAHIGMPRRSSYSASKAALEALARCLAVEWAPRVRVNCVAPGYTATPMVKGAIFDGVVDEQILVSHIPAGRLAEPEEMGRCIAFLASEESSFVTGQTLIADGGMTIKADW